MMGTYSDARVLTLKEIFILTGLPDKWSPPEFASENMIRQVIGEGVPPKLVEAILETIKGVIPRTYKGFFLLSIKKFLDYLQYRFNLIALNKR